MEVTKLHQMIALANEAIAERVADGTVDKESKRNMDSAGLFEAMVREAHDGVTFFGAGHHLMFSIEGDPIPHQYVSADTLIFDHKAAIRIWGEQYQQILAMLAIEPAESRDKLLRQLYDARVRP